METHEEEQARCKRDMNQPKVDPLLEEPLDASSTKENANLKILVVEDDAMSGELILARLDKVRAFFPNSKIILVDTMLKALACVAEYPSPDVALLDLSLPDSTIRETIDQIPTFERVCPVVIVTGHMPSTVQELLGNKKIEIVQKGGEGLKWVDALIGAITNSISNWNEMRFAKTARNLNMLRELKESMYAPSE